MENRSLFWHLLYVKARSEKKVARQLLLSGIHFYLPQIKTLRQWHDRKKLIEVPLFPSYIFVKLNSTDEYFKCQSMLGVCSFVKTNRKAVTLPNALIDQIEIIEKNGENIEISKEYFSPGQVFQIQHGALAGLFCEIAERCGTSKVLVRVEFLNRNIILDLPISYLSSKAV